MTSHAADSERVGDLSSKAQPGDDGRRTSRPSVAIRKDQCRCLTAGFCPRYNREMPQRMVDLCRSRDDYRDLWAKRFGVHDEAAPSALEILPVCIHRGQDAQGAFFSPVGQMPYLSCFIHGEATGPKCETCQDRMETRPDGRPGPSIEDYLPLLGSGQGVSTWAVGVTTAPRKEPTLGTCLRSLARAGWESPRIFAEPGSEIPPEFGRLPVTQRETTYRAWPNFYHGLAELLNRNPTADAFMLAQDDVLFWPGDDRWTLREYLERALWPSSGKIGAVSLYCSAAYHQPSWGWHKLERPWVWGALALIFPRDGLVSFLETTGAEWLKAGNTHKVDIAVGVWATSYSREMWHCSPSLAKHVGLHSTVWTSPQSLGGKRSERAYLGDMVV